MAGSKKIVRLSKAAREFNVGMGTIVEFLGKKGFKIEASPNFKLEPDMYALLVNEFHSEKVVKEIAHQKDLEYIGKKTISLEDTIDKKEKGGKEDTGEEEFQAADDLFITNVNADYGKTTTTIAKEEPKEENLVEEAPKAKKDKEVTETTPEPPLTKEKEKDIEKKQAKPQHIETESKIETEEKKETSTAEIPEGKPLPEVVENIASTKEKAEPKEKETPANPEITSEASKDTEVGIKVLGSIDLSSINQKTRPAKKSKAEKKKETNSKRQSRKTKKQKPATEEINKKTPSPKDKEKEQTAKAPDAKKTAEKEETVKENNFIATKVDKLTGPKILDKIVLPTENKHKKKPVASSSDKVQGKKKRRRIRPDRKVSDANSTQQHKKPQNGKTRGKRKNVHTHPVKHEPTEEEIQKQIKETLARLSPTGKSKSSKYRRQKRSHISQAHEEELKKQEQEQSILKVTEFLTANEIANMMDVNVNEIIKTCMQLGLFVSINQRLDAETIAVVAEEYGFHVKFVDVEDHEVLDVEEEEDDPAKLVSRAPIVTVMGHVDHGKTKLLDYIRKANVVAGEAGGITQHIGAYEVVTESGKSITFLDTPGHEAFTAMRARGAKVTDIAIIVIATDDNVMPQTKEAINHAQAAGVPIVFALNKVDKPTSNVEHIKEQLAAMNILVEDWGGKYQSQEVSAITGQGINELLEKVLLEAEMLELKANADKPGKGTVIEAALDKGRGYVATILVQDGTIRKGDLLIAGPIFGRVKAMFNERAKTVNSAGPSQPVLLLGLNGAPQAGDIFNVMKDEKEAKAIATRRQQLIREQNMRSQKHITLDEIGRRIAIGDFKELNIIVKGDVDGSIEALGDALLKLSTPEVQVNIIHKAVGAITESDILLASASDAIIIGFQVRPMPQARKLAELEQIDIRLYSVIYKATEEIAAAIEGMLAPKMEEKITCNVEVRETFKITKVGTIAGCYVLDGKINRNTKIRLIRDGIVVYTGKLGSLKRFKDDVKEVSSGYECGLNIANYNDIKVGDFIEGYEEVEVARKK